MEGVSHTVEGTVATL